MILISWLVLSYLVRMWIRNTMTLWGYFKSTFWSTDIWFKGATANDIGCNRYTNKQYISEVDYYEIFICNLEYLDNRTNWGYIKTEVTYVSRLLV